MNFNLFKSSAVVPPTLGVFLAAIAGSTASAEFYNHTVGGVWYSPALGEIFEDQQFEETARWDTTEYFYDVGDGMGYSITVRQQSVLFEFVLPEDEEVFWYEHDFNGWVFNDVYGTIAGFDSVEAVVKTQTNIDTSGLEVGVFDEDSFYVNFGSLGEDQYFRNGDSVRLVMNFVPGPAAMLSMMGLGVVAPRRRRA